MSKPDAAGGSLENILSSIRKSLSEQSTDALSEAAAVPANQDHDARPSPRKRGLTQRLAGATAETFPSGGASSSDDLSDLLEEAPQTNAAPAPEAAPAANVTAPVAAPAAASDEKDPLWFLSRRDEPALEVEPPSLGPAPEPQTAAAKTPAEPKLTRPEVLRASMPPFFGSSTETTRPAVTPVERAPLPAADPQLTRPQGAALAAPAAQTTTAEASIAREGSLLAAAAESAAARPPQAAPPQPVLNGKDAPDVAAPSPNATLASDMAHNRALEVMVLDLLKPMLRQWLDENMPRMVAEALSEEVQRARAAKGDAKNT